MSESIVADDERWRLLFLTQGGDRLPSVRFRVLPYVRLGSQMGYQIGWRRIPKNFFARFLTFLQLPHADSIVLQKKLLPTAFLALLQRRCRRLYYDFDDAVWTHHPGAARATTKDEGRFAATCRRVDGIIAGNRFLAQKAQQYHSRVTVLPTPIDTTRYRPAAADAPKEGPPTVGWMGTAANQHFLPEVLERLRALSPTPILQVVSNENRLDRDSAGIDFHLWSAEAEIRQLQTFDVGLMPLSDDEYTRGKCGFKLLQYMACGVVPVASAVGFNTEIIDHGEDGFLVEEITDWRRYVGRLVQHPGLRRQMADKAREKVVARFDLKPSARSLWKTLGLQA
ncbi:MAG: glycosyltransferase family 4 protein [Desulfosarcinaceae bacterium]|nr:glycosyltransferase family 4 protein [Desulfosarcinaceae bacterium]